MAKTAKMKYTFKTAHVPGLPKYRYETSDGKPLAVGLHWVGNYKSYKDGEIAWMSRNWNNAFVHAFADHTGVTEVANTDYLCWGIGPKGNGWMVQIEMVHSDTREQFFKCLDHYIFWSAYQHYWYDMGTVVDNAEYDGWGTVWTHNAVSRHLGGTDHADPMDYISRWGVTLEQLINKMQEYVTALYKGDSRYVKAIGEGTIIKTVTAPAPASKPAPKPAPNPATYHTIKKGETLWELSRKYKTSLANILKLNAKLDPKNIKVGTKVRIK